MLISAISTYNMPSKISFGSGVHYNPKGNHNRGFTTSYAKDEFYGPSENDEKQKQANEAPHHEKQSHSAKSETQQSATIKATRRRRKAAAAAILAGAVAVGGYAGVTTLYPPADVLVINVDENQTVRDIAGIYEVPLEILTTHNNVTPETKNHTIEIPEEFDYLEDKIDDLRDCLYNPKLTQSKRNQYESEMSKLQAKRAQQKGVATMYTDGSWVYIKVNQTIGAPTLRELFDLKPGAMSSHNDLTYSYETDSRTGNYYKNYDTAIISAGDIIKVRERDFVID